MGFFSRHAEEPVQAPPPPPPEPEQRQSFFRRLHDNSPTSSSRTSTAYSSASSSPTMSSGASAAPDHPSKSRSLLRRTGGHGSDPEMDPSIVRAREHVLSAEAAEREADRILAEARQAVHEAHIEVKRLEEEAEEEARRARIKAFHAKDISKRGKELGRHG